MLIVASPGTKAVPAIVRVHNRPSRAVIATRRHDDPRPPRAWSPWCPRSPRRSPSPRPACWSGPPTGAAIRPDLDVVARRRHQEPGRRPDRGPRPRPRDRQRGGEPRARPRRAAGRRARGAGHRGPDPGAGVRASWTRVLVHGCGLAAARAGWTRPRRPGADAAAVRARSARAVVPIWRRPWMVLGRDTFAGDLLARLGVRNVYADHAERYPRIPLDELRAGGADLVVLPDEPYRFTRRRRPRGVPRPARRARQRAPSHLVRAVAGARRRQVLGAALRAALPLTGRGGASSVRGQAGAVRASDRDASRGARTAPTASQSKAREPGVPGQRPPRP